MNMNKDYVFSINWEDRFKNVHEIGFLARIEGEYYLTLKKWDEVKEARKNGYDRLPGFEVGKIYRTKELFESFKDRVLRGINIDYCEELSKTGGRSMINSFFVEKLSEERAKEKKSKILKAYDLQEKLKKEESIKE